MWTNREISQKVLLLNSPSLYTLKIVILNLWITGLMKQTILILHGWGISGEKYKDLKKRLQDSGFNVLTPDLPGFGKEKLTRQKMTLDDYVNFVDEYIKKHNLSKVILLGHSFGGRIAAKFTVKFPEKVTSLILTGAPLIRESLTLKKKIAKVFAKLGKTAATPLPVSFQQALRKILYVGIGEMDYYKAGNRKETLISILSENLEGLLPKIKVPTYIIWGEKDSFTTLKTGKKISDKISGAKLFVLPSEGHKVPYENPSLFAKTIIKITNSI